MYRMKNPKIGLRLLITDIFYRYKVQQECHPCMVKWVKGLLQQLCYLLHLTCLSCTLFRSYISVLSWTFKTYRRFLPSKRFYSVRIRWCDSIVCYSLTRPMKVIMIVNLNFGISFEKLRTFLINWKLMRKFKNWRFRSTNCYPYLSTVKQSIRALFGGSLRYNNSSESTNPHNN